MNLDADRLAGLVTRSFELGRPPIDVERLAAQLGVEEILERPLVEDGRLELSDGSARILVRSAISTERRRFTIAHELCHLLLTGSQTDLVAARHKIGHDDEERFCEDFAAALLLPTRWVRNVASGRPHTLHTLRVVAGRSNTSLAASCVRLGKIAGWRSTLLHWTRYKDRWRFRWAAGLPKGFRGTIRSADRTTGFLDTLDDRGDVSTLIPIRVSGAECEVRAQVSVRRGSALVLAELD